nr:uncharacterized protein LOC129467280 isoform X1 [Symphalangus syndactylus]
MATETAWRARSLGPPRGGRPGQVKFVHSGLPCAHPPQPGPGRLGRGRGRQTPPKGVLGLASGLYSKERVLWACSLGVPCYPKSGLCSGVPESTGSTASDPSRVTLHRKPSPLRAPPLPGAARPGTGTHFPSALCPRITLLGHLCHCPFLAEPSPGSSPWSPCRTSSRWRLRAPSPRTGPIQPRRYAPQSRMSRWPCCLEKLWPLPVPATAPPQALPSCRFVHTANRTPPLELTRSSPSCIGLGA